ncbi:MAG: alpha-amylase family glycosyl hydrolase [Microthrixaceae bacterium]
MIVATDGVGSEDRRPWWQTEVVYQIYPRSFADSNGDGIGDLAGIAAHLDHLVDLGVGVVWLSPFYRSPMADFGYDVSDHCDVDPVFGTLEEADALIAAAHERGVRVLVDFVPNHVSDQHPWFLAARSGRDDPHREWFHWRDPAPDGGPPNNWSAAFGPEHAWTLDEASGQYYLHLFLPEQPDVDWNHPGVVEGMHDVLRFWMERGVDGFRADVVHCIGKDPALADMPEDLVGLPAMLQDFGPGTHEQLRGLRRLVDSYPDDRVIVGETYVLDREQMMSYLGDGDELHLAFNFLPMHCQWEADKWRDELVAAYELADSRGSWPTWLLSNHDNPRHRTRYGTEARARAAAVLLLTLRGTPFLYMGEELGLEDAEIPADRVVDPGGRDGCRAPLPWTPAPGHGWPVDPWLPFTPDAARHSVEAESGDPTSMLSLYRDLLRLRRSVPALHRGTIELLDAPEGVVRWRRRVAPGSDDPGDVPSTVEVAVNFGDQPVDGAVTDGPWLGGTHAGASGTTLGADEARVVALW